ncbi:hypothetical protein MTR_5g015750 [Medicago truncatula]|uniref:Uncharacterized protein n=1 Tax=Medicago truncatula TaxID=3880 RepID=G7K3U2_MEDTR|nr:hypothetical protein MTR_5g015750 [Medicago truncatula]
MKTSFLHELLNGISISSTCSVGKSSKRYLPDSSSVYSKSIAKSRQGKLNSVLTKMNMFGRKGDSFAHGVQEHGNTPVSSTGKLQEFEKGISERMITQKITYFIEIKLVYLKSN